MGILKLTKKWEDIMENEKDQTSEGLNQIFEIINAKGDEGELKQIVQNNQQQTQSETQSQVQSGAQSQSQTQIDAVELNDEGL